MIFWLVLFTYMPSQTIAEMLSAIMLPLGGLALWRWAPGALRNLMSSSLTPAKVLTIAVATMAFAGAFQSIWRLVYLWLRRPTSMTSAETPWASLSIFVFDIALILYLASTRRETDPPMPTVVLVLALGAIAVTSIGFFVRGTTGGF